MSFDQLRAEALHLQKKAADKYWKEIEYTDGPGRYPTFESYPPDVTALFGDIPALYAPFENLPDPAGLDGAIDDATRALELLSNGAVGPAGAESAVLANVTLQNLNGVGRKLERWTGDAADAFEDNFVRPFPAIVNNQFIAAAVVRVALVAQQHIWTLVRDDIDKLLHTTDHALDALGECDARTGWTVALTVTSSLAGVLGAIVAGGQITAAVFATAASAAQVAGAVPPMTSPPAIPLGGDRVAEVIANMRKAIAALTLSIENEEAKIIGAINGFKGKMEDNQGDFQLRRPSLTHATAKNITGNTYMGTYL